MFLPDGLVLFSFTFFVFPVHFFFSIKKALCNMVSGECRTFSIPK